MSDKSKLLRRLGFLIASLALFGSPGCGDDEGGSPRRPPARTDAASDATPAGDGSAGDGSAGADADAAADDAQVEAATDDADTSTDDAGDEDGSGTGGADGDIPDGSAGEA